MTGLNEMTAKHTAFHSHVPQASLAKSGLQLSNFSHGHQVPDTGHLDPSLPSPRAWAGNGTAQIRKTTPQLRGSGVK